MLFLTSLDRFRIVVWHDWVGVILSDSDRFFANFDLYLVWDSSPKGSEWLFGFARDSSASRAEGENRKFIIGKSIFSIWIWVYPFSARHSRLRPLNDDLLRESKILRLKALNDMNYILNCFKIIDFLQWHI